MNDTEIIHGDCMKILPTLPGGSVDLVLTDPPYGLTKLEWDRPVDWPRWWTEARRVARPDAAFVLFAQQPMATDLINSNRDAFKYELVWSKNVSTGFLDANRRPLRSHELVLIFGDGIRYNRVDWPREVMTSRPGAIKKDRCFSRHYGKQQLEYRSYIYSDHECPKSVLTFARPGNFRAMDRADHYATQKPPAMLRWLIESYSRPGETVLDPFAGSGTTLAACLETGRRAIGIELDERSCMVSRRVVSRARMPLFEPPEPDRPAEDRNPLFAGKGATE